MTAFLISVLILSIGVNTQESDLDCFPSIMVPRNTGWRAGVSDVLRINCTVVNELHCWKNLEVFWCKIGDENECIRLKHSGHMVTRSKRITESEIIFFLIFRKISLQDAGLYRCEINSSTPSVSHGINVTVTDTPAVTPPVTDETHTPLSSVKWFYVIIFAVFGVTLLLAVSLIMSTGVKKFPNDEVIMTTVTYEEAENSSVQD